jgi:cytochrome c-type biogenesis protein CcmE
MNRLFVSIVIVFVVVGGLMVFQSTRTNASAVVLPSEIRAGSAALGNVSIRVAGRVADESIESTIEPELTLRFSIVNPGSKDTTLKDTAHIAALPGEAVPVFYRGLKPDMLRAGRDVIIDGVYRDGVLQADSLMTQCPSKYEPPAPKK